MPLMEELKAFLSSNGIRLNTNLGQHFLVDEEVLNKITKAAEVKPSEKIVEIGPGCGVLTRELLKNGAQVEAIELDKRMIPLLKTFCLHNENLRVIEGNALEQSMPNEPYKIVANIPYHITSPLLRHVFLESKQTPESMTLLIQREVAEKICDDKSAGLLTVLVALFGKPELICLVPPKCFVPEPKVDSAVIKINCFKEPKADKNTVEEVFRLTKLAFSQKRKMLSNSIGKMPGGAELLESGGIDPDLRPEHLTIEDWLKLANSIQSKG